MNIRRLWSQGSNGHQALAFGPPTKEVLGQCTFSCLCTAPILQQFVYHYRKEVGVGSSPELTTLPCNVAKLIDNDFCNMHKTDTQLKGCEAAAQESAAALTRIGMQ